MPAPDQRNPPEKRLTGFAEDRHDRLVLLFEPAPGDLRAFDVRTGKMVWTFHTIPQPGEFGSDTWPKDARAHVGGANVWSELSVDETRGIVFAPTGSAVSDFYGADRKGQDLFGNSLVALNAETGKLVWYFQTVHHDTWDYDLESPPVLIEVQRDGEKIPAVAASSVPIG